MSKTFPFFKFIATEWLTGDIVFEDFDVQGLFVNICALYWQRSGYLTIDEINNRYKNPPQLERLIDHFLTVNEDGSIIVWFLHEQLIDAGYISKTNSGNGAKGGRPVQSVSFRTVRFYLLECFLNTERFYKVGITTETIARRFSNVTGKTKKIPYNFSIMVDIVIFYEEAISLKEKIVRYGDQFSPKLKFAGRNECFAISEKIISIIQESVNQLAKSDSNVSMIGFEAKISNKDKEIDIDKEIKNKENSGIGALADAPPLTGIELWKTYKLPDPKTHGKNLTLQEAIALVRIPYSKKNDRQKSQIGQYTTTHLDFNADQYTKDIYP